MANTKVFMGEDTTFTISDAADVYGGSGNETLKVFNPTGLVNVGNTTVERLELSDVQANYQYQQNVNQLDVYHFTGGAWVKIITLPLSIDTTPRLAFTDGSADLVYNGTTTPATLGGTDLPAAQGAITPATFDTTDKSTYTGGGTDPVVGQLYTLTTATQTVITTSGNDTIDGSLANSAAGDVISDPSTTDADTMTMKMTSTFANKATITNIENISAQFEGFGIQLDAESISNSTIAVSTSTTSQNKATITNLASNNVNIDVGTGITDLVVGAKTAGAGSTTVKLAGGTLALSTPANNLHTLNLNSSGTAANTVTLTHNPTSMTVTGDQDLTISGALANFAGETLTNSLTGKTLTMKNTAALAAVTNLASVGSANYDLSAASGAQVVTFGAGTTSVKLNNVSAHQATFTASGAGTSDVLNVSANKTYEDTNPFKTANYETVNITDASGAVQTLTNADFTGASVNVTGTYGYTFGTAVTASNLDASTLTSTAKLTVTDFTNGAATTSTIKGTANDDTIGVGNNAGEIVNVDTGNGKNTVSATLAVDTTIFVVTGGTGVDTVTLGAGADTVLAGAGDDVIDTKTGNDYVVCGEGNDAVTISTVAAGDDAVLGEAGDDTVIAGAVLTVADTLVGGEGTDTLHVTDDTATTDLNNVTQFEKLDIINTAASAYTTLDTLVASGTTFTVTTSAGAGGALTFNGAAETDGAFNMTVTGVFAHILTGGAGNDTIDVTGAATTTAAGGAGIDTIKTTGAVAFNVYGGAGADLIDFNTSVASVAWITALTDSTTGSYDVITNYTGTSEKINLANASLGRDFVVAADVAAAAATTNGIATGKFTFDKAAAVSLSDAITKVGADVKTAGNAVVFTYGADVYFFADTDGAATTANDILVKLAGVAIGNLTVAVEVFTMA